MLRMMTGDLVTEWLGDWKMRWLGDWETGRRDDEMIEWWGEEVDKCNGLVKC